MVQPIDTPSFNRQKYVSMSDIRAVRFLHFVAKYLKKTSNSIFGSGSKKNGRFKWVSCPDFTADRRTVIQQTQ